MVQERRIGGDRRFNRKGIFVVVDGLDGIGKGEIERAIVTYEAKLGRAVLDTVAFCKAHRRGLPGLKDFWNPPDIYYDTLSTAEPTYAGTGHSIRNELISNVARREARVYSPFVRAQSYSIDREVQMKKVVVPALENGLNVIQARCCAASLVFQSREVEEKGLDAVKMRKYILGLEGNIYQLRHAPDLLIIPTIQNVDELVQRLEKRNQNEKSDDAVFENPDFQKAIKPHFESRWLKEIFEKAGTQVAYLDAGVSESATRAQAVEIYKYFLAHRFAVDEPKVPPHYRTPKFKQ